MTFRKAPIENDSILSGYILPRPELLTITYLAYYYFLVNV